VLLQQVLSLGLHMDNLIIFIPKNGRKKTLKSRVSLFLFSFFLNRQVATKKKNTASISLSPNFINGK